MPGGLAARVMGWQRRMGGAAGPLGASGEASNGEPVLVELFINGAWVDITAGGYVMVRDDGGQISISRGIRAEGSQTDAATSGVQLKNPDGRFSPRNPSGVYYGLIGRNQPIRVSVPDGNGGKSYRIWGDVYDWAQSWDSTGNDVWTDAGISGILRRLSQAPPPERSVIYTAITDPLLPAVVAYWPGEDPTGSTSLASALVNGSLMTWTGTPSLAAYSGLQASDPLPDLTTAVLSGSIATYADPTATQVRFLASIPVDGLSDGKVLCAIDQLDYAAGSTQFWELYYTTTGNTLVLRQHDADGLALGAELTHTLDVRGRQLYVSVELQENGTSIDRALRLTDINNAHVYSVTDTATLTQLTRVTRVRFGPTSRSAVGPTGTQYLPGVAVGHITVENAITATTALGVRLNPIGETAGRRIQRLCGEENIPFDWVGDLDDTAAMGAQGRANPLSLMQEAALADGGMLYESLTNLGLGYRTRTSLYNQDPALVLDYAGYNLAQIPTPVEDDQRIQNKITVTVNGVSQTYEATDGALSTKLPPVGVGAYGTDLALNLSTTDADTLLDQAAWRVHLGTVDEARYPKISVNLAHPSFVANPALKRAVLALRQGDRIQILNPPAWLPPDAIDQIILGSDPETITHFEHRLTFNCCPASPYSSIGILDSAETRIDTDGSELVANISSSSTVMGVRPSDTQDGLWTKDPAEFPFDVKVSGEIMRVTAISDLLTDTFTRTVSNGWGTNDSGFTWGTGGGAASDYSVNGSVGAHLLATAGASRRCFLVTTIADFDVYVSLTADQLATGDFLAGGLTARYLDSDNLYSAQIRFSAANAVSVVILKRVNAVETVLGTHTTGATFVAGTFYRLRFKLKGNLLRAKAWLASDVETPEWQVSVMDGDLVNPQFLGFRSIAGSSSTNVNPSIQYDNYAVVSPQLFTTTRSVNGVVKAQVLGADVRLARPTHLAL